MLFAGIAWRELHVVLGHSLVIIPLLLVISSFAAKRPPRDKGLSALLFILTLIQPYFVFARTLNPLIAALHPVNAMVLFALPIVLFRRSRS
jgi:hypothetical protein